MTVLRLLLGDQLNSMHSWFHRADPGIVYVMMEVCQETDYVLHHAQKVLAIFAAMRDFARLLERKGCRVEYLRIEDQANTQSIAANLDRLIARHKAAVGVLGGTISSARQRLTEPGRKPGPAPATARRIRRDRRNAMQRLPCRAVYRGMARNQSNVLSACDPHHLRRSPQSNPLRGRAQNHNCFSSSRNDKLHPVAAPAGKPGGHECVAGTPSTGDGWHPARRAAPPLREESSSARRQH